MQRSRMGAVAAAGTVALLFLLIATVGVATSAPTTVQLAAKPGLVHAWSSGVASPPPTIKQVALAIVAREPADVQAQMRAEVASLPDAYLRESLRVAGFGSLLGSGITKDGIDARISTMASMRMDLSVGGSGLPCIIHGLPGGDFTGVGVGCVLGAAVPLILLQDALGQGTSAASMQETPWDRVVTITFLNEEQLVQSAFTNSMNLLNATQDYLDTAADNLALNQLGNATFNGPLVLAQSGVAAQIETIVNAHVVEETAAINFWLGWLYNVYNFNGRFCGSKANEVALGNSAFSSLFFTNPGANGACPGSTVFENAGLSEAIPLSATTPKYIYVAPGASIGGSCTAASVLTGTPVATNDAPIVYTWNSPGNANVVNVSSIPGAFQPDIFKFTESASNSCNIQGFGIVAVDPGSAATGAQFAGFGTSQVNPGGQGYTQVPMTQAAYTLWVKTDGGSTLYQSANVVLGGPFTWAGPAIDTIFANVVQNAQTYWSFLRGLGFTSASQIPSNCVIPLPYNALPAAGPILRNLTLAQTEALYFAWMSGLARSFNVSSNSTNFCGSHAGFTWTGPGNIPFGNPNENLSGVVYTLPVGKQIFGNRTTWALNGSTPPGTGAVGSSTQLWVFPTAFTVKIPVGQVFEVPQNSPINAVAVNLGIYLTLRGNGTNVSKTTMALPNPGAAIFLTSCSINGTQQTTCVLKAYTINATIAQIGCATGVAADCQNPSGGPGGFGFPGLGGIFGAIGSFLCFITFNLLCGGAANLVGEVIALALILFVVAVGIVSAFGLIEGSRRRARGSQPPGA